MGVLKRDRNMHDIKRLANVIIYITEPDHGNILPGK